MQNTWPTLMNLSLKHPSRWPGSEPESRRSAGLQSALAVVRVLAVAALLGLGKTSAALGQAGLIVSKPEQPTVKELEVRLPPYPDSGTLILFPPTTCAVSAACHPQQGLPYETS